MDRELLRDEAIIWPAVYEVIAELYGRDQHLDLSMIEALIPGPAPVAIAA